jgi:hypothetical protein
LNYSSVSENGNAPARRRRTNDPYGSRGAKNFYQATAQEKRRATVGVVPQESMDNFVVGSKIRPQY